MNKTTIIILAAGESSRMERPKQLLAFKDKTLLRHVAEEAQKSGRLVIIVLGANRKKIKKDLINIQAEIIFNKEWKNGLGTSIKSGLEKAIEKNTGIENCILCVCDQPYISAGLFQQLINKKIATGKNIIACSYAGTMGTPVLFDKKYFDALLDLHGNEGAKKLLHMNHEEVALVTFEKGEIDIDTKADYKELLKAI